MRALAKHVRADCRTGAAEARRHLACARVRPARTLPVTRAAHGFGRMNIGPRRWSCRSEVYTRSPLASVISHSCGGEARRQGASGDSGDLYPARARTAAPSREE